MRSSAGIERSSAASWLANAPATVLKLVTRPLSAFSSSFSAANVRAWPRNTRCRSLVGSWPSSASVATAVLLKAFGPVRSASLKPSAPLPSRPLEYSFRNTWRSARVSLWSAVSTSPNCTGAAVCVVGIVFAAVQRWPPTASPA